MALFFGSNGGFGDHQLLGGSALLGVEFDSVFGRVAALPTVLVGDFRSLVGG
jgi:hypothetical protein